ncbi:hypothetical protein BKA69DRAFT_268184 [Paraphysoderma sedebokerense]|nr:hypothetical protein BKA69DRAFT_268184 [Paraphysoderma sedebokerense]
MTAPRPKRSRYSKGKVRVHIVGGGPPEYQDIIPSSLTLNIDPSFTRLRESIPISNTSNKTSRLLPIPALPPSSPPESHGFSFDGYSDKLRNRSNQRRSGTVTPGLTSEEYDKLLTNLSENIEESTLLPLLTLFGRQIDRLDDEEIAEEYQHVNNEEARFENDEDNVVNEAAETEVEADEEDNAAGEEEVLVNGSERTRNQDSAANCVRYIAPAAIRTFLRCLSSDVAPLHQLVRPVVEPIVRKYVRTKSLSPFECTQLEKYSPVFYQFLLAVRYQNNGSSDSITPLVSRILDQSLRPFQGNDVPEDPFTWNSCI